MLVPIAICGIMHLIHNWQKSMKKYTLQICYRLYNRPHGGEEKINENQQIAKRMRKERFFLVFDRNRLFPENLEKFSISFNLILLQSFGFFNSQGFIFLQTKFPPNLLKPIQWGSNGNPPFQ